MKYIIFILFVYLGDCIKTNAQSPDIIIDNGKKDSLKIFRPTIKDYQFYTQFSEKKVFDTVFSVDKSYTFTQYNKQDNFGKIAFPNIGAGFQDLIYKPNTEQDLSLLPSKKSFFVLGIKDIRYYDVKTPTTAFIYNNGLNNGGMLQSTYTQNIGKNLNLSVEYMGLRSEGFYQRGLASSNHIIFAGHYLSNNKKYELFSHYIHQNIFNEENGGISNLDHFLGGDSRFNNRENLTVNLKNTHSKFSIRRYYLSQSFTPFSVESFPFKIKHSIYHQTNKYIYVDDGGESYYPSNIVHELNGISYKFSKNLSNNLSIVFDKETFKAEAGIRHQNIHYETKSPIILNGNITKPKLQESRLGITGNLSIKLWDKLLLHSDLEISNAKKLGNYINSTNQFSFEPLKNYLLNAHFNFKSSAPSLNYLINSSFYKDYNYNFSNFKNQNITEIGADIHLKWFKTKLFANYFRIDNMAYFDNSGQPQQSDASVNISQIGGEANFNYGKFHLNTNIVIQNILNNKNLLPLPQFIGRANLYYQNRILKKVAEIQTGIKAYYFSKFDSREYFPVLNEFILPSKAHPIGGQPITDVYFNFKVKRMMVFIEAQHFNTTFTKNKSYAAPYYPIADFRLNLGLVWYLFH